MTDDQLIQTMLRDYSEDLTDNQREAFADMEGRALSEKQRRWVHGVAERLGIHVAGAENAFSALPERARREHLAAVRTRLPWETGAVTRPKKPPGRGVPDDLVFVAGDARETPEVRLTAHQAKKPPRRP